MIRFLDEIRSGCLLLAMVAWAGASGRAEPPDQPIKPVPNRIVVLTFDDSVKTHFTTVRPLLKKYGFGATFFITEGFDFRTNHRDYMTWEEIAQLHRDGFEIGNHTRDHAAVTKESLPKLREQLEAISRRCREHGIPSPVSFAYPGNAFDIGALPILQQAGIRFARRGTEPERPYGPGRGVAYEIGLDHPLLLPTAGDARPRWEVADFVQAAELGRGGRIAVLQFHGVPDRAHPWVSTDRKLFGECMRYLADHHFTVIAMRDLAKYVPLGSDPHDPLMVIHDRKRRISASLPLGNARPAHSADELRRWLMNMKRHRFSVAEMVAATGLNEADLRRRLEQWRRNDGSDKNRSRASRLLEVLPYPGGRHPRLGFRDGAIRPQRETKVSVFVPWRRDDYVVLDIPEAIWMRRESGRELLFLAHTHVPTYWDKRHEQVARSEWQSDGHGGWRVERHLPNGVRFGANVWPAGPAELRMKLWLENGSHETLRGLRVQNCAMLAACRDFARQTNDNKIFRAPYAAVHDGSRRKWLVFAWEKTQRAWGNIRVPCLHADPEFPPCAPGERRELAGWLSFYEGNDIDAELERISQRNRWEKEQ